MWDIVQSEERSSGLALRFKSIHCDERLLDQLELDSFLPMVYRKRTNQESSC
jgi:hypothetical protein